MVPAEQYQVIELPGRLVLRPMASGCFSQLVLGVLSSAMLFCQPIALNNGMVRPGNPRALAFFCTSLL